MRKSYYWTVRQTHSKTAYNDEDEYSIVNGVGNEIAKFYNGSREKLTHIADAHNLCLIEATQAGEESK